MTGVSPMRVQQYIKGLVFPTSTGELIAYAGENGADEDVLDTLRSLPDGKFQTPSEVSNAIDKLDSYDFSPNLYEEENDEELEPDEEDGDI